MSQPKHTRGPWLIKPEEVGKDYIRIRGDIVGTRYKICNVITPVYAGVHDREMEETRANARLIAESPEMFELLLLVAHLTPRSERARNVVQMAGKLVTKIKGES